MNLAALDKIKKLTISALVSDDLLMKMLVLKGGNAIDIAYDLTDRGSLDIDFSIDRDFTEKEKARIQSILDHLLNQEFNKEDWQVIDISFTERPHEIDPRVKDFWGGYLLEFKVVPVSIYKSSKSDIELLRRAAIPLNPNNSPKFSVEISKYEYLGNSKPREIFGSAVQVYSPEMLALEKLRALCQQDSRYKDIVIAMTAKSRARDFYDIHNLTTSFEIDFKSKENIELLKQIFSAKRVPIEFILGIPDCYNLHFRSWQTVLDTIDQKQKVESFKFYFDFVIEEFKFLFS